MRNLLETIDQTALTPIVIAALNGKELKIIDWKYEKMYGGSGDAYDSGQVGLYLFTGRAVVENSVLNWQVVLKIFDRSSGHTDTTHINYWQREPDFYESHFPSEVPSGLGAPRCLGIERPGDGTIWLWLEYLVDAFDAQWDLERYGTVARHLGRFNGTLLITENKSTMTKPTITTPTMTWFSNGRAEPWLQMAAPQIERIPSLLGQTSIGRWLTPANASRTLALWERRSELLAIYAHLPKTFCHHDAHRRNLFACRDHNNHIRTIAIDWAFAGVGVLGEDVATLMAVDVQFGGMKADKLPRLDEIIFEQYLLGLAETDWDGDAETVRLGFTTSAALTWGLGTLWWMIPAVVDPEFQIMVEGVLGAAIDDLVDTWRELQTYLLDLADESQRLTKHLKFDAH
jgi:hypothetical protein